MKVFKFFLLLLPILLVLQSCTPPYEEGPVVSLQSKKSRIANVWRVSRVTKSDGSDITSDYAGYKFTFQEDGKAFSVQSTILGNLESTGDWQLVGDSNNEKFRLFLKNNLTGLENTEDYKIIRLIEDEFFMTDESSTRFELTPF